MKRNKLIRHLRFIATAYACRWKASVPDREASFSYCLLKPISDPFQVILWSDLRKTGHALRSKVHLHLTLDIL